MGCQRAAELRRLASLIRSGEGARSALLHWQERAEPCLARGQARVARRLRLGDDIEAAVGCLTPELGSDAGSLAFLFAVHRECGGDLAGLIESLAVSIENRGRSVSQGRASGAAAILSSRMVAGLPLLCLPLMPVARAPLLDPLGVAMLATGIALALAGLHWIRRLVPMPSDRDHPVATVAEAVAGALASGVGLRPALDRISTRVPEELLGPFARAGRRVALGSTWAAALGASSQPDLSAMGSALLSAQGLGVPVAETLRRFAFELRARRDLLFDEQMRRAPVLMVLPLVSCILPSFLLLALGPFVRGLSVS
jgi:Flp pilus assembly protein TadB